MSSMINHLYVYAIFTDTYIIVKYVLYTIDFVFANSIRGSSIISVIKYYFEREIIRTVCRKNTRIFTVVKKENISNPAHRGKTNPEHSCSRV